MQIPELLERLHGGKPMTRHAAAEALGRMGPRAATPEVLRALTERLGDVEDVRWAAAWALARMSGATRPEVIEVLTDALLRGV